MGHFLIAVDATGQLRFNQRHCEHCFSKKHGDADDSIPPCPGGQTGPTTRTGLGHSRWTAVVHREHRSQRHRTQDCELKAFARLAQRSGRTTRSCCCACALTACTPTARSWTSPRTAGSTLIHFPSEGSLPALWADYQGLLQLCPRNHTTHSAEDGSNALRLGRASGTCRTTRSDATAPMPSAMPERRDGEEHFFAWAHPTSPSAAERGGPLGNRGGTLPLGRSKTKDSTSSKSFQRR